MRFARAASWLALAIALGYGLFFVFGPTYAYCTLGPVRPGETTPPQRCGSASFLEAQGDHLFPALAFIAAWSLAPILAVVGVRLGRWAALVLIAFAFLVEASSIISLGGGFFYAILVAPLLLIALVARAVSARS